jgi:hypothetical protein
MDPRKTIYAIYALEDNDVMLLLLHHLKPLEEDFDVTIGHDDPIHPGKLWKPQSDSLLHHADVFLLLVSDAFMHSEFVKQLEFKMIIDRYKEGRAIVIPIIVDTCPWDIDFNSDDYDFNLKELQVLPDGGKPISEWNSFEQAYSHVAAHVRTVVASISEKRNQAESDEELEKKQPNAKAEDQSELELSDKTAGDRLVDEEKPSKLELEADREAEAQILRDEAEAQQRVEEELRRTKEVEAAAKRKSEEGKRRTKEAEIKRKAEKEHKAKEKTEAKANLQTASRQELELKTHENVREFQPEKNSNIKKRIRIGLLVVVLAAGGIWVFSLLKSPSEKPASNVPQIQVADTKDSIALPKTKTDSPSKAVSFSSLAVGDTYDGGIIFSIDHANKTGKIAHRKDAGPMPWKDAIKIQEQLGEGWRLPTLDELELLYRTIGQGATNRGQFVDDLYWSATPYDAYQARLLRFSDGNTSYHYNKNGEYRKFRVRAIRDFSQ